MTCIVNPDNPNEVVLRDISFKDRLVIILLPKGKEVVFTRPAEQNSEKE